MAEKFLEQSSESERNGAEINPQPEIFSNPESAKIERVSAENPESRDEEIQTLKRKIDVIASVQEKGKRQETPEQRAQRIKDYQDDYLPDHLREKPGIISRSLFFLIGRSQKFKTEGRENVPEKGPFLVVCNHFGGGEPEALLKVFENTDLHFGAAKERWWNSSALIRWFLKKFGTIPVEESLANLTQKEKEESLERQDAASAPAFKKVMDREEQGIVATNVEFLRQSVALLSRGDAIGLFPEGLWLNPTGHGKSCREKQQMKKCYRGIELIATQYKKITGEDLPIVPTAFIEDRETSKKTVVVGQPLFFEENDTELSDTDWAMAHVAAMLPEEQRGYYKDVVKKIK